MKYYVIILIHSYIANQMEEEEKKIDILYYNGLSATIGNRKCLISCIKKINYLKEWIIEEL